MWDAQKRFWKFLFGKKLISSNVQDLVITTQRKDFAFEELDAVADNVQFTFVFDNGFYSFFIDSQSEKS